MITPENFDTFLAAVKICYAEESRIKIPTVKDFPDNLFDDGILDVSVLEKLSNETDDIYISSVSMRILGLLLIQKSRDENTDLDLSSSWRYISQSIKLLKSEDTISSIGSQGFLSIPLFNYSDDMSNFEFIRLHIWDKSLDQYIDTKAATNFSIHTHSFYAHSWIITGRIINDRYIVTESKTPTTNLRFTINYNKTIKDINQHTSVAVNDKIFVVPKQISHEIYMSGGSYQIKEESYHNSGTDDEDGLSATFFCFTAKNGKADASYVVGPDQQESGINRKMHIDPLYLLNKIEQKQNEL